MKNAAYLRSLLLRALELSSNPDFEQMLDDACEFQSPYREFTLVHSLLHSSQNVRSETKARQRVGQNIH